MNRICQFVLSGFLLIALTAFAEPLRPVKIALDAEFGHRTSTADDAIKLGMEIAIDEINQRGGVLGGRQLALVTTDNRGVPARGVENLRELAATPDLVAIFGSKFSPVVLAQRDLAHELKIPLLSPWAAADSIIDHDMKPSFTFRLSLRDGWVMPHLLNEAKRRGFKRVGLMVPNGAWGRSNQKAAESHLAKNPVPDIVQTIVYQWADSSLASEYLKLVNAGAQAVIFVGNEPEVGLLIRNMVELPRSQWLPLISHWGASAGDLPALAGPGFFEVDFQAVQTFSFFDRPTPKARKVLDAAMKRANVTDPARILSAVGLAHAYDLVNVLAMAINKAGTTDRVAIRDALESVGAYDGLVRKYDAPFTRDRHEALTAQQLFMARWRKDGAIVRVGH